MAPASAGTLSFGGTFDNTNPPAASGGRCAGLTVNIGNFGPFYATGASNFGAFTAVQSHCLDSGPPIAIGAPDTAYYDGLFTYSFASGATLFGTYVGLLSNAGTIGVIDNVQNFVVTGGTGRFANASGSFLGIGTIRFAGGPPSATLTISEGAIAVPEPVTWGLMIVGFVATGLAIRSRRLATPARMAV
ncbi:PEPxxWA-CTERM sorting domain-containing protein [Sphingosinicellaceae bacterium]|nr:PEPxxWA-CTERM sorting domain-containing protein [Sphingosinicellaceae bacterium]